MKNNIMRAICAVFAAFFLFTVLAGTTTAFADGEDGPVVTIGAEETKNDTIGPKAIAAAVAVGLAAAAGAIGMGIAIGKSTDSMARQPEAADKINSAMMLGLVFIETMCIYALIVAILIIFVL